MIKVSGTKFVLVVEDDDEIRSLIVSSLKAENTDGTLMVVEARDGREAIQFAGRQEFHCVVTDLNMPRTSGQELIKVLLGNAMNANTPTVVVSAAIDDDFLAAFRGVRCITKPFDPAALSHAVMREIKLGRLDERMPIHLLNPFVEATRSLLIADMSLSTENVATLAPVIRRPGELVEGDIYSSVTLTTGMMQARIGFSFEHDFLLQLKNEYFASRRTQWASMDSELLARFTTQILLEKSMPALAGIFGVAPRVAELLIGDLTDTAKRTELSKMSGVSIALSTDQGRVFVSALAPVKAKRGQA